MTTQLSSEYLNETRQPDLYAAVTITYIGAVVAVALRLFSRKLKAAGYWIDDWFIVAALISATAMLGMCYWWIPNGYGRHREAFGSNVDYNFFLGFFLAEIIYTFIITFVKYSILSLYWRVFGKETIKWPVRVLAAIVTAWGIAVFFLSLLTCVPPKAFWDKTLNHAECNVNNKMFLWGISIPNILTDLALLCLPIRYVLRLNTSVSQKRLLIGTFLLGGFVCIASIMRLVSVVRQDQGPDAPWNWVDQGIWATIESNFAVISACLPTLRPVWTRIFRSSNDTKQSSVHSKRIWTLSPYSSKRRAQRNNPVDSLFQDTIGSSEHVLTDIRDDSVDIIPEQLCMHQHTILTRKEPQQKV